jgi:hypothetical protein
MADKAGEGASAAATASASANQRLKLQTDLGRALMYSRGFGAEESKAAFIRARELAAAIDNATERFIIYFGLWIGNILRGELGFAREIAETFLREAQRGARTTESGVGRRLVPLHCRMRVYDRDLIRGGYYGQWSCEPHPAAKHMAAPTSGGTWRFSLPTRSRPQMEMDVLKAPCSWSTSRSMNSTCR